MRSWPRFAALIVLLSAMLALMILQWLPALAFLPVAGGLLIWENTEELKSSTDSASAHRGR